MKKTVSVLLIAVLVFAMGCTAIISPEQKHTPKAVINQSHNKSENNPVQGVQSDTPSTQVTDSQPNTQTPSYSDQNNFIGEKKAKEIALEKAELSENEVVFEKVDLDIDDRIPKYEIEFSKGKTEYSADVNAYNGKITDWEVDFFD